MNNKLVKMFGGGKPVHTTTIARLDKDVMWTIDHKEKEYTEMSFAQMRALMDSLGTMVAGGADPMTQAQSEPTIDTAEWEFSEPKFDIKRTGKSETIAGQSCEQAIMTMTTEGTNRKTGEKMTLDLAMDMMLANSVPGQEEMEAFGMKMAKAMGYEMESASAQSMMKMLEMYGIDAEKLAEESEKLEGFAMKTVMTFSMGGDAMEQAQAESETSEGEDEKGTAEKNEETPTDASGLAAKALGGLFGKKDKKEDKDKARDDGASAPPGALMWMTTTVTGIETGAVAASNFEVPAGYKLKSE